jgi:hypothetical protein
VPTVRASNAVRTFGAALIGMRVGTRPMGDYPGGWVTVIKINPDPAAPEIVCHVRHPTWRDEPNTDGEIGVFAEEWLDIESLASSDTNDGRLTARPKKAAVSSSA